MKTIDFYVLENEDDMVVVAPWELANLGMTKEKLHEEAGEHGKWLSMSLKPATALLERQIRAKTLQGNDLTGFRSDPSLLDSARFEVVVESWWKETPASMADYDAMHPNLADRVSAAINKHLRPSFSDMPTDFFTKKSSDN